MLVCTHRRRPIFQESNNQVCRFEMVHAERRKKGKTSWGWTLSAVRSLPEDDYDGSNDSQHCQVGRSDGEFADGLDEAADWSRGI